MLKLRVVLGLILVLLAGVPVPPAGAVDLKQASAVSELWLDVSVGPPLVDWFNRVARTDDIARIERVDQLGLLERVQAGRKLVIFKSAAEAEQYVPEIADKIDIIGYNLEHGPANPLDEQADPLAGVKRMNELARQYDLKLALGPDHRFALSDGVALAPYVDLFVLQVQRVQTQPETVLDFVLPLVPQLRQANPELEVSVQVRTEGDVEAIGDLVEMIKDKLDGISILTSPETVPIAESLVDELRSRTSVMYEPGTMPGEPAGAVDLKQASAVSELWLDVSLGPPLVEWFNRVARTDDIARIERVDQLGLLEQVQVGRKLVIFKSAAEAEQYVPEIADKIDIIGYNLEHGPANPLDEQADPLAGVKRMNELARQYDLKLALGPDHRFALSDGVALAPYVDLFVLQVQRVQTQPETVLDFVLPLVPQLRQANPELEVSVQVRTEGDVEAIGDLVEMIKDKLDGVSILTSPETVPIAESLVDELRSRTSVTFEPGSTPAEPAATTRGQPLPVMVQDIDSTWLLIVGGALLVGAVAGGLIVALISAFRK